MNPVQTLDSYLDFVAEDEILIRGTRIALEQVIAAYNEGASPEEIALNYPALGLETVYGVITYYLANRERVAAYLERVEAGAAQQTTGALVQSLRRRLDQRHRATEGVDQRGQPIVHIQPVENRPGD